MKAALPRPPSINHIYGYTSRRGFAQSYITKQGKEWFKEAGYLLKNQIKLSEPITYKVKITILLKTNRAQDIDNINKPILDLLEDMGVLENDNLVWELHSRKCLVKGTNNTGVEIEIFPLDE